MYCDTEANGNDKLVHLTAWDPEPLTQYVTADRCTLPVLMQARIGYRPNQTNGKRSFCACRQRRLGSSENCVCGKHCLGTQGDVLNRLLVPHGNVWQPGVVICDSCAAMISLSGRAGDQGFEGAQHLVFDYDLSQNTDEWIPGMTYREMGVFSIGEQPLDRIRHIFQQLKEQYDCLCDVEFDERGIPANPKFCGLMRQVYHHHVNTAHARKSVALETYSL